MKRIVISVLLVALLLVFATACSSTSDTSGDAQLYLTDCILPGEGGIPGTFILPNGTRVVPGSVVEEGDYLYAAGFAKYFDSTGAIDYALGTEMARQMCADAVSGYLRTTVSGSTVQRTGATMTNSSSGSSSGGSVSSISSNQISEAVSGLMDCGFVEGPDGTLYILQRTNLSNVIEGYQSDSDKAAARAERYGDRLVNNFIDSLF